MIDNHFKTTLKNFKKLHEKSPAPFVYFLAGSLPTSAILHQRQLSLFSMICRLPDNPLNIHARNILITAKPSTNSWFHQIRNICMQYCLPHPLQLLDYPPTKDQFKILVKKRVLDFWESKLRAAALPEKLPSLKYFHPNFMSLCKPHPLWTTAGSSPYEVNKACIQARMLSGRFRTEQLCRHWSKNKNGYCLAPKCKEVVEDIEHIRTICKSLETSHVRLRASCFTKAAANPHLHQLLIQILVSSNYLSTLKPTESQFTL